MKKQKKSDKFILKLFVYIKTIEILIKLNYNVI